MSKYKSAPVATTGMPSGIPYIVSNEAAERFSFYGMKGILMVFMTKYLLDANGQADYMSDAEARTWYHSFTSAVYFFPIFGAIISDWLFGKYRTIIWLSIVYCFGHFALAIDETRTGLMVGLILISLGSGGIKPCVSAHVGDQFGQSNQNLLEKVFGWFYFAINLGAAASTLLTPWLLRHYGPAWAFGVPGILMALATIFFWMGRNKFIHIPAAGFAFVREVFSRAGVGSLGKLFVIYCFVAMFWALFDQTGSAWVLQAENMDREFLGIEWLPSQIHAINPVLIMTFIPLFSFWIYPGINKVFTLTPIRKISIGLFLTVPAFAIPAWIEAQIQAGAVVNIGWQLLAYAIITAAEVFVSITCLEFSYTQAPTKMKSFVMACFLMSVSLGNLFVAGVNVFIQNPSPAFKADVAGKYVFELVAKDGTHTVKRRLAVPVVSKDEKEALDKKALEERKAAGIQKRPPTVSVTHDRALVPGKTLNLFMRCREGDAKDGSFKYLWVIKSAPATSKAALAITEKRYTTFKPDVEGRYILEANFAVGDVKARPKSVVVTVTNKNLPPVIHFNRGTGIIGENIDLDAGSTFDPNGDELTYAWTLVSAPKGSTLKSGDITAPGFATKTNKLEGANYYWFFSIMMLITAFLFVPYGRIYKAKTYIQEEQPAEA